MHQKSPLQFLFTLVLTVLLLVPAYANNKLNQQFLINAQTLKKNLRQSSFVTLDVRDRAEYDKGHIPGAVNIPVASLFSNGSRPDLVISLNMASSIFGNAGINHSLDVVIYDNGKFIDAARAFWVMELYGHKKLTLLDGGYPSWTVKGFSSSTARLKPKRVNFNPTVSANRLSTKLSVRLAIDDGETTIIDARRAVEYLGKESKFSRLGHIPSAINVPSAKNYKVTGKVSQLRSDNELKDMYSSLSDKKKIITYCNKGKESALTYFVLRKLGFDVSAYDGSWYEWSGDSNLPIINKK